MATMVDVARQSRVSIATVSRVLNDSPHKVNRRTRERVLRAIKVLDYRPNALAKGLLIKKTMTIGVIIPDISNPYYAEIVRGIQDLADPHGYAVMLQNTDRREDRIIKYIYLLREKAVDGVIFSGGILHAEKVLDALKELRERVVVIGRHRADFPAVMIDNVDGAAQATRHLIECGHRRIGFINGPGKSTTAKDRFQGYKNALAHHGLRFHPDLVKKGDFTFPSGYRLAGEFLAQRRQPTAIFAANDQMAFGAIKAAREHGLSIPRELAVAGFDNVPLSSFFIPPLTTMEVPMYDLGVAAMQLLVDLMSGKTSEKLKLFSTRLVVRESTRVACPQQERKG